MTVPSTVPRGGMLARAIADHPAIERDTFVDVLLRTPALPRPSARALRDDDELVDCIPSGVAAVARALAQARVGPDDIFVDVGSGLGTVAVLAHLLTGATVIGVEIQPDLVAASRRRADDLGLTGVSFVEADARTALPRGSVYYLYTPCVGDSMARVQAQLLDIAQTQQIAICTLGFDLPPCASRRVVDDDSLFLTVHESVVAGATLRRRSELADPFLRTLTTVDWVAPTR